MSSKMNPCRVAIIAMLAGIAFITLCYHALTIYGVRQGHGGIRAIPRRCHNSTT